MKCSLCQTGKTDIPALKSGEFFSVVTDTTTTSAYKCSYRKIQSYGKCGNSEVTNYWILFCSK